MTFSRSLELWWSLFDRDLFDPYNSEYRCMGQAASLAATVQAGYGALGSSGKVFASRVLFDLDVDCGFLFPAGCRK